METNTNQVKPRLKTLIAEELDVNLKADEIADNTPFFEGGLGIDSIAIVELITLIEEHFGIQFTDDDLVPESFRNLEVLSRLVADKMSQEA